MSQKLAELRLHDLDGLGEIRVTAWTAGDRTTFRFAIHSDAENDEPNETFDVSSEEAAHLAMGIAGTVTKERQSSALA